MNNQKQLIPELKLLLKTKVSESYELVSFLEYMLKIYNEKIKIKITNKNQLNEDGIVTYRAMVFNSHGKEIEVENNLIAHKEDVMSYIYETLYLNDVEKYQDFIEKTTVVKIVGVKKKRKKLI